LKKSAPKVFFDCDQYSANFSANRITPASKFRMGLAIDYENNKFDVDGEEISSIPERRQKFGTVLLYLQARRKICLEKSISHTCN